MAMKLTDTRIYKAIADAIRAKTGGSADIAPEDMADEIASISSGFDFSKLKNVKFQAAAGVTTLDLSSVDTSNFTHMQDMFAYSTDLITLDVSSLDMSNVGAVNSMFSQCTSLVSINFGEIDTSHVTNMSSMFNSCAALASLDLSSFNTSNVTGMGSMFYGCASLTSLDLSNFNTSKVTGMNHMFRDMTQLASLNLSDFDTSLVTSMSSMFYNSSALTDIIWSQKSTVQALKTTPSSMGITSSMKFYVPDALVSSYKSATNWSTIASQIYPISQLPASVAALYGIE